PDRWISASNYSAADTPGMNYAVDRGIKERRFYYRTPSGVLMEGQLTHPTQTGVYEVYLQVMDEYGAWSYPWTGTVNSTQSIPANAPPVAAMTWPAGTQPSSPTMTTSLRPAMKWNQTDANAGTVFKGFQLQVTNE